MESNPASVREDAEFFVRTLTTKSAAIGQFDEGDYFVGEFSLIAGTACRLLFRKDEARRWFARAEAFFVLTENGTANIARLAYQKLAMDLEERRFDEVLEVAPMWAAAFRKMNMEESALKCLFLEGAAYRELGEVLKAIEVFSEICTVAERTKNVRLLAIALGTLVQLHRMQKNLKQALTYAARALPLLQQIENRVGLAKLRWAVGDIFREQGNPQEALGSYRAALQDSEEIGLRGDVVAIRLVVAEILLDSGLDRQAEWEIRAALPIIEEEEMAPEGFAALGLLRESVRRRQIDRAALRELHGYFPQG